MLSRETQPSKRWKLAFSESDFNNTYAGIWEQKINTFVIKTMEQLKSQV